MAITIKPGDTLSGIAKTYGTTVKELAQLNGISNVNRILAGAVLQLPQRTKEIAERAAQSAQTIGKAVQAAAQKLAAGGNNPSSYNPDTYQGIATPIPNWTPPTPGDNTDLRNIVGSGWGQSAIRTNGGYAQGDLAGMKEALNAYGANLTVDNTYDRAFEKALKTYGEKVFVTEHYTDPVTGQAQVRYSYVRPEVMGLPPGTDTRPYYTVNSAADQATGMKLLADAGTDMQSAAGGMNDWPSAYPIDTSALLEAARGEVDPAYDARIREIDAYYDQAQQRQEDELLKRGMGRSSYVLEVLAQLEEEAGLQKAYTEQDRESAVSSRYAELVSQQQQLALEQQKLDWERQQFLSELSLKQQQFAFDQQQYYDALAASSSKTAKASATWAGATVDAVINILNNYSIPGAKAFVEQNMDLLQKRVGKRGLEEINGYLNTRADIGTYREGVPLYGYDPPQYPMAHGPR